MPRDLANLKATDHCSSEEYRCTHVDVCVWQELEYRIDVCLLTHGAHIEHIQLSKKNAFLSIPVAVNNSVKVGRLVFLLQMSVITENIMKRPV